MFIMKIMNDRLIKFHVESLHVLVLTNCTKFKLKLFQFGINTFFFILKREPQ